GAARHNRPMPDGSVACQPLVAAAVALAIALFERGAILGLVLVARPVAVVVVVVAFAIPLGAHRIVAIAMLRVVAAGVQAVTVADLRRGRSVRARHWGAARIGRIDGIGRSGRIRRVDRSGAIAAGPAERLAIPGLESLAERAAIELEVAF